MISLNKFDTMATAMRQYADKKQIDVKTLKFTFDGEILSSSETPMSLDLEGGECIDVFPV